MFISQLKHSGSLDLAEDFENQGLYEEARNELRGIWPDTSKDPNCEGLHLNDKADIEQRCGSVSGYLANTRLSNSLADRSRDLLTRAHRRFVDLQLPIRIAETENYLAQSYLRAGAIREAETWLHEALAHDLPNTDRARLFSYILEGDIFLRQERYQELINRAERVEKFYLVDPIANTLAGSFCNHWARALKNTGRIQPAKIKYEQAIKYFDKANHQIYLGTALNNLAHLLLSVKDLKSALECNRDAIEIFATQKDAPREAFAFDTAANILFAAGHHKEALRSSDRALDGLIKSRDYQATIESYRTNIRINLSLGQPAQALHSMAAARDLAGHISKEFADQIVEETAGLLAEEKTPVKRTILIETQEFCKLQLDFPYPVYDHAFDLLRITNNRLPGIKRGMIAVVENIPVKCGDLAVLKDGTDLLCGVYSEDPAFGYVSFDSIDRDPIVKRPDEITLLGKITGYFCPKQTTEKVKVNAVE